MQIGFLHLEALTGAHDYAYDGEGKLISVDYGPTNYTYDAEGRCVAKSTSGTVSTVHFYDVDGRRAQQHREPDCWVACTSVLTNGYAQLDSTTVRPRSEVSYTWRDQYCCRSKK
jgi:hypothetical protein